MEMYFFSGIDLADRAMEIIWNDYDDYSVCAISKDDQGVIGSASDFDQNDFKGGK